MQLVAILFVTGAVRSGCDAASGPPADLPGREASLASLADSADALARAESRRTRPLSPGERLDPNRAREEELDRLPGIGPATARAIVSARDSAPFESLEDLTRVRGIGPATLERLRPALEVAYAPARSRPPSRSAARTGIRGGLRGAAEPIVDINRAGPDELRTLPGVGPVLADRIVEDRAARGSYRKPEDLLRVRGIGPALLERLRARIRL